MNFRETYIESDGRKLFLKYHSPARSRGTILFLHGFPDDHDTYSYQMDALGLDYRVASLEMRGVGRSQRPTSGKDYAVRNILPDIDRVIEYLGSPVHLVGHDWGSMIGWCYATDSERSANLLTYQGMSAPHPGTILKCVGLKLATGSLWPLLRQFLKSWYIWYFQIPFLPEWSIRNLSPSWRGKLLRKGGMAPDDPLIAKSKEEFASITTGSINLYRQLLRRRPGLPSPPGIPTRQIIPSDDLFVSPDIYCGHRALLAGPNYTEILVQGPHWIHRSNPDLINGLLKDFIERHSPEAISPPKKAAGKKSRKKAARKKD